MQNPEDWKQQVYETKYEEKIKEYNSILPIQPLRTDVGKPIERDEVSQQQSLQGTISWYNKGKYKDGTEFTGDKLTCACYKRDRGKTFRVTYLGKSVDVFCNDTGAFESNGSGRLLDLSVRSFEILAPKSVGILRGAKIEII